jgi:hypothetical protein
MISGISDTVPAFFKFPNDLQLYNLAGVVKRLTRMYRDKSTPDINGEARFFCYIKLETGL